MQGLDVTDIDQATLDEVIRLVHVHTGITMTDNKRVLLQSRLRRRLSALGLVTYEQYVTHLSQDKSEIQEFVNSITTNETNFFRTARVWEHFTKEFLPTWHKQNLRRPLRIWSGAASTGEEIYTIAMCCEEFRLLNPTFDYHVLGSDISTKALAMAKSGVYSGRSTDNLKISNAVMLTKYFDRDGDKYTVKAELKAKTEFIQHNLLNLPPKVRNYDIVFLRNVLIYFQARDQEKILANASRALVPCGTLILGESESLSNLQTKFLFKRPLIYENSKD